MAHKFPFEKKEILDDVERLTYLNPVSFLAQIGLKKGMTVADIGCGTGFFTTSLAEHVGEQGKVYAVDVVDEMLEVVNEKIKRLSLANVETRQSKENNIPLPNSEVDLAFTLAVFHEFDDTATLDEIKRVLKDEGIFVVIDWKKEDADKGPPKDHRVSEEEVKQKVSELGFSFEKTFSPGQYHYGLIFRKE